MRIPLWLAGLVKNGLTAYDRKREQAIKDESWRQTIMLPQQAATLVKPPITPMPGIEWCDNCGVQLSRAGHFCDQCGEVRQRMQNTEPNKVIPAGASGLFTHSQLLKAVPPPTGYLTRAAHRVQEQRKVRLTTDGLDIKNLQQLKKREG